MAAAVDITGTFYAASRARWRAWLVKHHATTREIWLIYYKRGSGRPRVEYGDAVEEALCFGWIDSTVKSIDAVRYAQRFTPRKAGSNWSTPNLLRVKRLVAAGLMTSVGVAHLPSAKQAKAFDAKHQKRLTATTRAPRDLAAAMRANAKATALWKTMTPGYKRVYIRWIGDARQPATRARRIATTVSRLARGLKRPMA